MLLPEYPVLLLDGLQILWSNPSPLIVSRTVSSKQLVLVVMWVHLKATFIWSAYMIKASP